MPNTSASTPSQPSSKQPTSQTQSNSPASGEDRCEGTENIERLRLNKAQKREENWQRWGPYLSERQWGTVREDYSESQDAWRYFPHDHARSRAYRWGEDGLLGITDREGRLCFSFAFWNGNDSILKERLFGVSGPEGNHGEDVKECYYYLDSTPTHSYMKALYKYPQASFPYSQLSEVNRLRSRTEHEYELLDTGIFDDGKYFDCTIEYCKASPDDLLIKLTVENRGEDDALLHVLPHLWFRNSWTWGCDHDGCSMKPRIKRLPDGRIVSEHETLGKFEFYAIEADDPRLPSVTWMFTENETNPNRHPGCASYGTYFKDAFHEYVVNGKTQTIDPRQSGTKCTAHFIAEIPAHGTKQYFCRLRPLQETVTDPFGAEFEQTFAQRREDANSFYQDIIPARLEENEKTIMRLAYAGLLWSKQFYHYVVDAWLTGDPNQPPPPASRQHGRNSDWGHLFNRDVISMPDKWEYPWYAAWDLAFHMIPMAKIDLEFAKQQLILFLREWYMHPNGQIPAYEWALGDVNPPVHAWACWHVYQMSGPPGARDRIFLARTFQKLLLNFTWWVNRKDVRGKHVFSGGFLGLDNIGVFDRSKPLPGGGYLDQADATGWMAFFCGTMLQMALELADGNQAYSDMASKFFEHYVAIAEAMNSLHGTGLWEEEDGFYYDHLSLAEESIPLRIRSMVGLIPLCTSVILREEVIQKLPSFNRRMEWFLKNRRNMAKHMTYLDRRHPEGVQTDLRLLAIPSEKRFRKLLSYLLDEEEFLSPFGIRSLSAIHREKPFVFQYEGRSESVTYVPGESDSYMFGGNSNWRGPVWFPMNFLIIESIRKYHEYYGDTFTVECPVGSGVQCNLMQVADEIERRLVSLFQPDETGQRPCFGTDEVYRDDPHWNTLLQFHEYFHGDDGRGLGASHQTGWTALVATMLEHRACRDE